MTGRHVDPTETAADEPGPDWDAMLDGLHLPETEDEMTVAHLVAALQAPGTPDELRGAESAVAALVAARSAAPADSGVVVPLASRRTRRTGLVVGSALVLTIAFAGTAAAAATGSLPAPVQRMAASLFGAPAPAGDTQVQSTGGPARPSGQPSDGPAAPQTTPGSQPGATPPAPSPHPSTPASVPSATSPGAAPSTPPGQSVRPSTPPGQTKRPTTGPGQSNRPTTPPGQTNRPTSPPGPAGKPHPTHS